MVHKLLDVDGTLFQIAMLKAAFSSTLLLSFGDLEIGCNSGNQHAECMDNRFTTLTLL